MAYFKKVDSTNRHIGDAQSLCSGMGMHLTDVATVGDKLVLHWLWEQGEFMIVEKTVS